MNMWKLKVNEEAVVTSLSVKDELVSKRLNELGIRVGQAVVCLQWSPFGGPRAYRVSSGIFALDREVVEAVQVEQRSFIR